MDKTSNQAFRVLPPAYRNESRIVEETTFSIELLRVMASLVIVTNERKNRDLIEHQAGEFASRWEEQDDLIGFFALDCHELRTALRLVNTTLEDRPFDLVSDSAAPPINIVHAVEPILRGNIELIETRRLAAVQRSPEIMLFLKILDDKNQLSRDNHHVGWHYHYCKSEGARSDTMLSFDTNQLDRHAKGELYNVPLFWERHRESRAKFKAKAQLWGDDKRRNIRDAAFPELSKHPLQEFRRPKNDASAVWPRNAMLSVKPLVYSRP